MPLFIYIAFNKQSTITDIQQIKTMMEDFDDQPDKGLFTFYREQAELEEQIKRQKRLRKLEKIREAEERKKMEEEEARKHLKKLQEEEKQREREKERLRKQKEKKDELAEKARKKMNKQLYEPKHTNDKKFGKHRLGNSVIIINGRDDRQLELQYDSGHVKSSMDQRKGTLKKLEEMINHQNNNRYFLQNREMPSAFGSAMLERGIVKTDRDGNRNKTSVKPSYFNMYGQNMEENYNSRNLAAFSYEKLPQIHRNRHASNQSELQFPKRYKSQRVEEALKSGNRHLIRHIRQNIKEESLARLKEQVMLIHSREEIYPPDTDRLTSKLNDKQKRLIEIIRQRKHQ